MISNQNAAAPMRRHSSRRGITILEIMVVMTGVAAMLALCAITIQLLMRLNADGHTRLSAAVSLDRLARQIRQDAHASNTAQLDQKAGAKTASLRLTLEPKHDVLYEPQHREIVRVETKDGTLSRRESYSLPPGSDSRFELRDEGARRLVVLVVTRDPSKNVIDPPRPIKESGGLAGERPGRATRQAGRRKTMIAGTTSNSRRGMTTIAVLVCLLIITLISGALLKVGLAQRESNRDRERHLQAEWLAESGVDRALARLIIDRNYTGETWSITAGELGLPEPTAPTESTGQADRSAAIVTIAVEPIAGEANRRRLRVQADYPADPPRRVRHSQQMLIDLEPSKTK